MTYVDSETSLGIDGPAGSPFASGQPHALRVVVTTSVLALPEAKPRRERRPITDPEVLARRNAALARARAARAEKLAAARAGAAAE